MKIKNAGREWFLLSDDVNRSLCVNDLRRALRSLHSKDYKQLIDSIVGKDCLTNDTSCEDRRLVVIDVVANIGDVTSQQLLMTHVLSREPPVNEELRRVFIHCAALTRPEEVCTYCLYIVQYCDIGTQTPSTPCRALWLIFLNITCSLWSSCSFSTVWCVQSHPTWHFCPLSRQSVFS